MKLLVFGGAGFVGSAIAKSAVARGWNVISYSRSGQPYKGPDGHSPNWVAKVDWRAGDAFNPESFKDGLEGASVVVSTLGILLENDYKENGVVSGLGVLKGIGESLLGSRGNPLQSKVGPSYERMNRDAGVSIFRSFANANVGLPKKTFVYLSAEDIFRPFISSRYIETKREAENIIKSEASSVEGGMRTIFVRPSLIYEPFVKPGSTFAATVLEGSAKLQSILPFPAKISSLFPPSQDSSLPPITSSIANLATIPPIHVNTIAEAICKAIEDESIEGILGVKEMRQLNSFE